MASRALHDALGEGAAALRLEARRGVVRDLGARLGARLEADVHGGGVAVGRRGVQGRVELVGGDHPRPVLAQRLGDVAGERAESAELADDHTELLQRCADGAQPLELADGRDARAGAGAGAVDLQRPHGGRAADAVGVDAAVALEVLERTSRGGARGLPAQLRLDTDGVFGPVTGRALEINSAQSGTGPGVAAIRELERLGDVGTSLQEFRVVVGQFGGIGSLVRYVAKPLRPLGGQRDWVDELDPTLQASAANRHAATRTWASSRAPSRAAVIVYYSTRDSSLREAAPSRAHR